MVRLLCLRSFDRCPCELYPLSASVKARTLRVYHSTALRGVQMMATARRLPNFRSRSRASLGLLVMRHRLSQEQRGGPSLAAASALCRVAVQAVRTPPEVRTMLLVHAYIEVTELERGIEFYSQGLGLTLKRRLSLFTLGS